MPSAAGGAGTAARRLAGRDGGVVARPVAPGRDLALTWVRSRPRDDRPGALPVLVVPGGPGLASVLPYARFRARAAARGVDVVMVEHRGVGLSRQDTRGEDVPRESVTVEAVVDDLAAALDSAGIPRAVVYGSSYGAYLAQGLGARHPDRVAGMVLDSPMLSVVGDVAVARDHRRGLFWRGEEPALAAVAAAVRDLADSGVPMSEISSVVQVAHEFAGPDVLRRLLLARRRGRLRTAWDAVSRLGDREIHGPGVPYVAEPDLVAGITYGELGFGWAPDGGPLDPQAAFAAAAERHPPFAGEPFDLPSELPRFAWPTVVLSGDRDLRTPRPVAERVVDLVPGAVLLPLTGTGHSALDTHQLAALHVAQAVATGWADALPGRAARIAALPRRGASRLVGPAVSTVVRAGTLRLPPSAPAAAGPWGSSTPGDPP